MNETNRDIRVLVIGTDEVFHAVRNELIAKFESGVLLCFQTVNDELEYELKEKSSGFNCVIYVFSAASCSEDDLLFDVNTLSSKQMAQFVKIATQIQVPAIAVIKEYRPQLTKALYANGAAGVLVLHLNKCWSNIIRDIILSHNNSATKIKNNYANSSRWEDLKKSENQYRKLVQLSRDLIWSVDGDGRWTFVNDAVHEILGYKPEEFIGRRFTEFQDAEDAARDLVAFTHVLHGKKYLDYETNYRSKSGELVTLSFNAIVLYDENGEANGATGTATNVSAKRRAAEDLQEQKEFFRQIFDANPNPIAVRSTRGQFIMANKAFASGIGFETKDLIGKTYDEIIKDRNLLYELKEYDAKLLKTPDQLLVAERIIPDPVTLTEHWYQTTKKIIYVPPSNKQYILDVSVDLSERHRAEQTLKQIIEGTAAATAEDYFQLLVEHLASALNVSTSFIFAYSTDDSDLTPLSSFPRNIITNPKGFSKNSDFYQELLLNSKIHITNNAQNLMHDDYALHLNSIMAVILKDARGEPVGFLAIADRKPFDKPEFFNYLLTLFGERVGAELTRVRSEEETKKLERQLQQAQKMEAIGTLAAGVAHDLNNALGAVTGHLELVLSSNSLAEEQNRSLNIALDGCSRASSLIQQLLGFSRQGKYTPEDLNLRDLLKNMLEFLNCATKQNIKINLGKIPKNLVVFADKNQLQQVLMNLIINAEHAMPDGGMISIEADSALIDLPEQYNSSASAGLYTVISIRDNGCGIDPAVKDKIFEPFFTTKPSQLGTGLGLSMVYGIMQNHGGWVDVSSTLGKGSTFSLYFPNEAKEAKYKIKNLRLKETDLSIVLVIDDEPFLVDLTCKFLERSGIDSRGFTDATKALEWFKANSNSVSLVILDMKMPQLDGRTCFKKLRKIDPKVAVVILSGYIQDDAAREVINKGALQYFQKPLRYTELIDWVKSFISSGKLRDLKSA